MRNIVIPMAGAGSRFSRAGFKVPKPLIKINGVEMIRVVIENLRPLRPHRFIFVCQQEHILSYSLDARLREWAPDSVVVPIDGLTEGAACTVLAAKAYFDDNNPLMIANSDQYLVVSIDHYLDSFERSAFDGYIMTMEANDPKWSFVGLGEDGSVNLVVEKQVISSEATVGLYNFKRGSDFTAAAETMISKNIRSAGEFYVAPVYNELISMGGSVGVFNIGPESTGMHGLGTPEDLGHFLQIAPSFKSRKA